MLTLGHGKDWTFMVIRGHSLSFMVIHGHLLICNGYSWIFVIFVATLYPVLSLII